MPLDRLRPFLFLLFFDDFPADQLETDKRIAGRGPSPIIEMRDQSGCHMLAAANDHR